MFTYYYFNHLDYPVHVSLDTIKLTPYTFQLDGTLWENKSILQFYSYINKDIKYNIVDIGAQSGLYSLFAKYLPKSTFYSFEPFPDTYRLLNDNIKLNDITNVNTYNLAISDKEGETVLNTSESHNGLHTLGTNPVRFTDVKQINVNTTTLDKFFFDKDISVDFIKIDTEGHEYHILKGGINTIKKYKPTIQLEWNKINMSQCGVNEDMLNNLINELNYKELGFVEEEKIICPK
jgi:FkbM family methyltransferase